MLGAFTRLGELAMDGIIVIAEVQRGDWSGELRQIRAEPAEPGTTLVPARLVICNSTGPPS